METVTQTTLPEALEKNEGMLVVTDRTIVTEFPLIRPEDSTVQIHFYITVISRWVFTDTAGSYGRYYPRVYLCYTEF